MLRRLSIVLAVVAGLLFAAGPAFAGDVAGWDMSETRSAGHYEVTPDGLHIWTDDNTSNAKVAGYHTAPEGANIFNVGKAAIDWTGTSPAPGLQIVLDLPGGGATEGILVGESVYGDNWWLTNGSVQALKDAAPHHGGGQGSDNWGTLDEWTTALEGQGWIRSIGFSLGSGIKGEGTIGSLTFFNKKYTFEEVKPSPSESTSASPSPSSSEVAAPVVDHPSPSSNVETLPVTGSATGEIAGLGVVALIVGGFTVAMSYMRRRARS